MRGRLICSFDAAIARLDTSGTAADPDGAGPLASGFDDVFREPNTFTVGGVRKVARVELPIVYVPCQVETPKVDLLEQLPSGGSSDTRILLVFHFRDLERLGFLDANGKATIRHSDRLVSLHKRRTHELIELFPDPPGLYTTGSSGTSYAIGASRNLLVCTFDERKQGDL